MAIELNRIDHFYDKLYDWVITKGPSILGGLLLLFVGLWMIKLLSRWLQAGMNKKDINPSLRPFLSSLIIVILRILLVFTVMQVIGIQLTFLTVLVGGVSVAAGLALSGTLQNFASGVLILLLKPFVVGDNIIAQGQEGSVTSIQIFYTIVTTFDNRNVVIPNSKLSNEVIINISAIGSRRMDIELKFSYGIDYGHVLQIINKTIDEVAESQKFPKARIGVSGLESDGYKVAINIWVKSHGFTDAKLIFQQKIMENLKMGNVKLPSMAD